ncbi:putative bifunctional diguanylate cyclase/phosphodiesterase [Atopomonas sediminilitoris]|uniref:putative bifunctional diguanylate cyclase/phosphodiesterase n=1 Tax=Atopomonas sediminilitoris TaxID=2919919 RepID=UPI001F4E1DEC|nr:EAL domain-containing protein [Atopomonas sediminilitoris]MCJ8168128.1 EAL domain-containing protein [Atopomonas sediminilitoris]
MTAALTFVPLRDAAAEITQRYATELRVARTHLLYQGSRLPTLLMLLAVASCSFLHWQQGSVSLWLLVWLGTVVLLAVLRITQVLSFERAGMVRQAARRWRVNFLIGAGLSGISLGLAAVFMVDVPGFVQQMLVYGLLACAVLSASVAYAVSVPAFLAFALPSLLPASLYLLSSPNAYAQGWGLLGLIMLGGLTLIAWQMNRLVTRNLLRRFQHQSLIETLQEANVRSDALNSHLAEEVQQRRRAEQALREAHDGLERHVQERTQALAQTSADLAYSKKRLDLALEASRLALWDWNLDTDEVFHSRVHELFGVESGVLGANFQDLLPRLHPDDVAPLRKAMLEHLRGQTSEYLVEYRVRHNDGHWLWVEDRGRAVERDADGRVHRMLGTRRDISQRHQREEQQRLAVTVFDAASEGIFILNVAGEVLSVNDALLKITGQRRELVEGYRIDEIAGSFDLVQRYMQIRGELVREGRWQGELNGTRHSGEHYPQWLEMTVVRNSEGRVSHFVGFLTDLSARRAIEDRLRYLSHYDALTGLANRALFRERLHQASQRVRQQGRSMALLHIDLDRFKQLNESLGQEAADRVLAQIAQRLVSAVPEAELLARLSGDEFSLLIEQHTSLSALSRIASRLLAKVREPLQLAGHELVHSASVGISLYPDNAREVSALMSQAQQAMQHAKHVGGDTFQFFSDNLQACTVERLQLENDLRKAIRENQLVVYFQPKLALRGGQLSGAEALVRWRHPTLGLVAPAAFISLAEETGLIAAIGEQVLRMACQAAKQWLDEGFDDLRVAVNLSAQQLRQGNLVSLVRAILQETDLPPHLLELELTESLLLDNLDSTLNTLGQLKRLGVTLAIDDFGTGYSSLSYLKRLPVDCVKIDQCFVNDLPREGEDAAIIRAIIALAHALDLRVVAEGVEEHAQLDFLKAQQCDEVQGYLISPPRDAAAFMQLVQEQGALA